jgi:antitoxin (DNA-binding transcriptional repressor) of toxin-antitoxin stability system
VGFGQATVVNCSSEDRTICDGNMSKRVRAAAAGRNFSDLLNRVAYGRETLVITRGAEPLAEIRPLGKVVTLADLPKLMAELPHLSAGEARPLPRTLKRAEGSLTRLPCVALGFPSLHEQSGCSRE